MTMKSINLRLHSVFRSLSICSKEPSLPVAEVALQVRFTSSHHECKSAESEGEIDDATMEAEMSSQSLKGGREARN